MPAGALARAKQTVAAAEEPFGLPAPAERTERPRAALAVPGAHAAYTRAAGLTASLPEQRYLTRRATRLSGGA